VRQITPQPINDQDPTSTFFACPLQEGVATSAKFGRAIAFLRLRLRDRSSPLPLAMYEYYSVQACMDMLPSTPVPRASPGCWRGLGTPLRVAMLALGWRAGDALQPQPANLGILRILRTCACITALVRIRQEARFAQRRVQVTAVRVLVHLLPNY
jgi:hypothetical protein